MSSVPRRKRAWAYIRESKDELLHGYSPDEGLKQCRAKADALDADLVHPIVESAKRDEYDAPGLLRAIEAAEAGEYDFLISPDMTRLTGDPGKHVWFKNRMSKTAVTIHYCTAEFPDTEEGHFLEEMTALVSKYERAKTRARTQNGIRGKLARMQPICNGRAPYGTEKVRDDRKKPVGYRKTERFAVLERAVRELRTMSYAEVCAGLNRDGVPTPSGSGTWTSGKLCSLLTNATYAGRYEFGRVRQTPSRWPDGRRRYVKHRRDDGDEKITTFAIPALLDGDELAAAREAIDRRKHARRARVAEAADPFTLRGRLRCAHCGGLLSCTRNNGYRRYTCLRAYPPKGTPRGCSLPQVPADEIERIAWERLREQVRDDERLERALAAAMDGRGQARRHAEQVAAVRAEIAKYERIVDNAADVMTDFGKGTAAYARARDKALHAEQMRAACAESLAALERRAPVVLRLVEAEAIREQFADLAAGLDAAGDEPSEQRLAFRTFAVEVTVGLDEARGEVRLGRAHRYAVGWRGALEISGEVQDPHGYLALWDSQDAPPLRLVAASSAAAARSAALRARRSLPSARSRAT